MSCERVEQFLRYAIGVGIEEAHPKKFFDPGEAFKKLRQAVAQAQVFTVRSGVLPDQGDFARSVGCQVFRFAQYGCKAAAAKFAAQLRNDAKGARMIAALGDFDVCGMLRRG
jgi:hypothetical protein